MWFVFWTLAATISFVGALAMAFLLYNEDPPPSGLEIGIPYLLVAGWLATYVAVLHSPF